MKILLYVSLLCASLLSLYSKLLQLEDLVRNDFWPGNTAQIAGLGKRGSTPCDENGTQTGQDPGKATSLYLMLIIIICLLIQ